MKNDSGAPRQATDDAAVASGKATGLADATTSMPHRHLNHQRLTLAAIDDVIARGRWRDWAELRRVALADPALLEKIARVCRHYIADPYAQRYHFWMNYVEAHRATP